MSSREPRIICERTRTPALAHIGDWHDVIGHHRYYGSSAISGEPIAESRRGQRPRILNVCGF
jgi:hypothetical protein